MAPQDKYISIGGHRHRYIETGRSYRTMLLLHGISSSLDFYEQVIPSLSGSFRILALDLLGFGGSDKPAGKDYSLQLYTDLIYEFLEKTGSTGSHPLYATGHSMGGKYLLATAISYPSTFDKIVLSNTDGFIHVPSWARGISLPGVRKFLKKWVTGERMSEKMFASAFHNIEAVDPESYRKNLQVARDKEAFDTVIILNRNLKKLDMNRTGLRSRLKELTAPVLIIWGDRDRYISPKIAHDVNREIPCSRLIMFKDCGHSPMLEYPEQFSSAVREFILSEHHSS
jgi:pimeloyl-ACP methyl ester carboxylesterase